LIKRPRESVCKLLNSLNDGICDSLAPAYRFLAQKQLLIWACVRFSPHMSRVRNELNIFSIQRIECEFQSIQINSQIFNSNQLNFESIQTKYSRMRLLATHV